jgi:hypothetical protein
MRVAYMQVQVAITGVLQLIHPAQELGMGLGQLIMDAFDVRVSSHTTPSSHGSFELVF